MDTEASSSHHTGSWGLLSAETRHSVAPGLGGSHLALGNRQVAGVTGPPWRPLTPALGRPRLQLTLRAGRPPHCAPAGLFGVRADSVVSPGGMEHPPRPLLGAPPEATELLLLGARPPQGPLAHFTLCWQEGREEGEKEERGVTSPPLTQNTPWGVPPTCSVPEPQAGGIFSPEGQKSPQGRGRGGVSFLCTAPSPGWPCPPLPRGPTALRAHSPALLHSMVPLAAAEPSGQAG